MYVRWREIQGRNSQPMRDRKMTGQPTDNQRGKETEWSAICKVRDELPLGATKLLLAFYTYIDPIRADLYNCHVFDQDDEEYVRLTDNFITIDPPMLHLRDYKTKKTYGRIQIPLPDELMQVLNDYLCDEHIKKERVTGRLFENECGETFTRATFSKWSTRRLTRAFGKPMTLTAIRHNFTSQLDFNRPIEELHKTAMRMCHSVATQREYKWEVGKNEVIQPK
jgi:integrase